MECNLVWNQTRDYKIKLVIAICNHKFDFRPKLHDTNSASTLLYSFWNLKQDTPPAFLPVLFQRGSIATSEQNRSVYLFKVYNYF